uniref:BPTI/Kunitz inhibitor domain-containing protein n=1 Tax=Maylandia zebra TaxID=106582 RepID=A0A3P9CJB4_9CICH
MAPPLPEPGSAGGFFLLKGTDFASSLLSPLAGICFLGKDAGDCVNYTVRWFFDHKRSVCSRFWYSGCGGNENRFATQAECERVCLYPPDWYLMFL